jgi:hypothetical protein
MMFIANNDFGRLATAIASGSLTVAALTSFQTLIDRFPDLTNRRSEA